MKYIYILKWFKHMKDDTIGLFQVAKMTQNWQVGLFILMRSVRQCQEKLANFSNLRART